MNIMKIFLIKKKLKIQKKKKHFETIRKYTEDKIKEIKNQLVTSTNNNVNQLSNLIIK